MSDQILLPCPQCEAGWKPYVNDKGQVVRPFKVSLKTIDAYSQFNTKLCNCWVQYFHMLEKVKTTGGFGVYVDRRDDDEGHGLDTTALIHFSSILKQVRRRIPKVKKEEISELTAELAAAKPGTFAVFSQKELAEVACPIAATMPSTDHPLIFATGGESELTLYCTSNSERSLKVTMLIDLKFESNQRSQPIRIHVSNTVINSLDNEEWLIQCATNLRAFKMCLPYIIQKVKEFQTVSKNVDDLDDILSALSTVACRNSYLPPLSNSDLLIGFYKFWREVNKQHLSVFKWLLMNGYGICKSPFYDDRYSVTARTFKLWKEIYKNQPLANKDE